MNIEAVTQRAIDLHEKAFMPLSQALELALSEAAPSPIWPCAKLVIRGGKVTAESHQYAPGLPDGEHDVYPLQVDSDAEPAPGVAVGSCTYPDCACVPNGDVGCNSPNAAARGVNGLDGGEQE